jgi:predicted metal-dependent phosphotriesterase family hydrolase
MKRRRFLGLGAAAAARAAARPLRVWAAPVAGTVHTVRGPIDASQMGTTLVHEHVLVDFIGADQVSRSRYDSDEAFRTALPHLMEVRKRGAATFFECTPAYLGRDPLLLRRLSKASGLHIVTNTGYYGAANDIAVPKHAYIETATQLAARWTKEFESGIEGTGIRPGFVKIGVDPAPLSAMDQKLVEAGALCHLDTGLTLAIHTADGSAAMEILGILKKAGVSPEAYVWVHSQNDKEMARRSSAARQGAWVSLDGIGPQSLEAHVEAVLDLFRRGLLGRVLISQDAGWYHVGEVGGGAYRSHSYLFDEFLPTLRARGLTEGDLRTLLVDNPARAFAVRWRPRPTDLPELQPDKRSKVGFRAP